MCYCGWGRALRRRGRAGQGRAVHEALTLVSWLFFKSGLHRTETVIRYFRSSRLHLRQRNVVVEGGFQFRLTLHATRAGRGFVDPVLGGRQSGAFEPSGPPAVPSQIRAS